MAATMTSQQILDLVNNIGQAGMTGRTEAARRFTNNGTGHFSRDRMTAAQVDFLTAARNAPVPARATYAHPAAHARSSAPPPSKSDTTAGPVGLTPAQVAWLERLPTDPAQIPFNDAVELVRLARTITANTDKLLIRSVTQPVVDYHDARSAEVDLANAQRPLPPIPHEALAALADAIANETPNLTPDEAVQRASLALRERADARRDERAQQADSAQRAIDAHQAAVADRMAVHR